MSPHHTQSSMFFGVAALANEALLGVLHQAGRAFNWFELAVQVRRERRQLASLDARLLKDIGLDYGRAFSETSREFTDLPRKRA